MNDDELTVADWLEKPGNKKWKWVGIAGCTLVVFACTGLIEATDSISSYTSGTQPYIKQGSLFCGSKEKYDEQMEWIAQNQTRLTPGCLVTGVDIDVVFLDRGFLKSSVKSINNSEVYWVGNESLGQH